VDALERDEVAALLLHEADDTRCNAPFSQIPFCCCRNDANKKVVVFEQCSRFLWDWDRESGVWKQNMRIREGQDRQCGWRRHGCLNRCFNFLISAC